jgi:LCP family protein required for cell wall assembly
MKILNSIKAFFSKYVFTKSRIPLIIPIGAACAALVVVLSKPVSTVHKVLHAADNIQTIGESEIHAMTNENLSEEAIASMSGKWTVALFGLDGRKASDLNGVNSDVIMIVSVNNDTGSIKISSVYRDTCLKMGGGYRKANAAYCSGGPANAVSVLDKNLDLDIQDYIAVNWKTVAEAINILGGTDIEITEKQMKWINGYISETANSTGIATKEIEQAGMQHLDGVQTVAYCRIRYDDLDFGRTEKQRAVIAQLAEKAKSMDFAVLNNVIETVVPETASSIGTDKIISMMWNIKKYHVEKSYGFPEKNYCKTVYSNGGDFVFANDLTLNVSLLHDYLYGTTGYTPSSAVKEISEEIKNYASGRVKNPLPEETYHDDHPLPNIGSETTAAPTTAAKVKSSGSANGPGGDETAASDSTESKQAIVHTAKQAGGPGVAKTTASATKASSGGETTEAGSQSAAAKSSAETAPATAAATSAATKAAAEETAKASGPGAVKSTTAGSGAEMVAPQ